MSILLKRLMVLLFFPAGLVLLVTPLPTHHRGYVEQDHVFISASPLGRPPGNRGYRAVIGEAGGGGYRTEAAD